MFASLLLLARFASAEPLDGTPIAFESAPPSPAFELPSEVRLTPQGDVYIRAPDGSLERIAHGRIATFEAWCDAATCDVVLRTTTGRRIAMGTQARDLTSSSIFGYPVEAHPERLHLAEPARTGAFTPGFVLTPLRAPPATDVEAPSAPAAAAAPVEPSPTTPAAPPAPAPTATAADGTVPATGADGAAPIKLGALDKSLIDQVIKADMSKIRACYTGLLLRGSDARGKLAVKFVIAKDGTVSSATVKYGDIEDETFRSCVLQRFMRMRFPVPKGDGIVIVTYPFIFG